MKTTMKTSPYRLLNARSWQVGQNLGHEALYDLSGLRVRVWIEADTSYHSQSSAKVQVYDKATNEWHTIDTLPTPLMVKRSKIYVTEKLPLTDEQIAQRIAELAALVDWSRDVNELLRLTSLILGVKE